MSDVFSRVDGRKWGFRVKTVFIGKTLEFVSRSSTVLFFTAVQSEDFNLGELLIRDSSRKNNPGEYLACSRTQPSRKVDEHGKGQKDQQKESAIRSKRLDSS